MQQCLLSGEPKPDVLLYANTIWRGDGNLYDLKSLRAGTVSFTQKTFADFQKFTGSESKSRWESRTHTPAGFGADESALKEIIHN